MKTFTVTGNNFEAIFKGDDIEVKDEYHSMHDLYRHRMALNIALFNLWGKLGINVMKSRLHYDGTMFDGDYFIVMAVLPIGQISYHYHVKHWDKFNIPIVLRTPKWDGHTSLDVLDRLEKITND